MNLQGITEKDKVHMKIGTNKEILTIPKNSHHKECIIICNILLIEFIYDLFYMFTIPIFKKGSIIRIITLTSQTF